LNTYLKDSFPDLIVKFKILKELKHNHNQHKVIFNISQLITKIPKSITENIPITLWTQYGLDWP